MTPFQINYRSVYALRSVGYSGLENVCGMFNLPEPMTQKDYDAVSRILGNSAKMAADPNNNRIVVIRRRILLLV